jgi:hypothetical protein
MKSSMFHDGRSRNRAYCLAASGPYTTGRMSSGRGAVASTWRRSMPILASTPESASNLAVHAPVATTTMSAVKRPWSVSTPTT